MADYTGTVGQAVNGLISNIHDSGDQPVTPVNPPSWSTSNESILVLTPSNDAMSATGTLLATGTVSVIVTIDGIVQTKSIDVGSGAVAGFDLNLTIGSVTASPKRK